MRLFTSRRNFLIAAAANAFGDLFVNAEWATIEHSTRRQKQEVGAEVVDVKAFGARGDGISNDTQSIIEADAVARQLNLPLFFPKGVYLTDLVTAHVGWVGDGFDDTVIKYFGKINRPASLVSITGVNDVIFSDICFDGGASDDPTSWDESNYNRFEGSAGLSIESCKQARIVRCKAVNTVGHGFRYLKVFDGVIQDSHVRRARGKFGDGILILSSNKISVRKCLIEDYTRIGIVADRTDPAEPMCNEIKIELCRAKNGHDGSYDYGGTEFNAGVWIENCLSSVVDNVNVVDNVHRGISVCSGLAERNGGPGFASIVVSDCNVSGSSFGICVYSLIDTPIHADVIGCNVLKALIAFQGSVDTQYDSIRWLNCYADYDASTSNGRAFATEVTTPMKGKSSFYIGDGCVVSRWAEDRHKLDGSNNNFATADIGSFFSPLGPINLFVDGIRIMDGGPVYVRLYNLHNNRVSLNNSSYILSCEGDSVASIAAYNSVLNFRGSCSNHVVK